VHDGRCMVRHWVHAWLLMHGAVSTLNVHPFDHALQVGMLTWAACGALMSTMWVPNALPKRRGASSCASDAVATAMMRVVAMLSAADTQHALVPTELGATPKGLRRL
jgi:hypothetical protein